MIDVAEIAKARPFAAHGVEFKRQTGHELIADCPFTGKTDKFYLNVDTGAWHSKTMGTGGGLPKFLGLMAEAYREVADMPVLLDRLSKHRKLPVAALKPWGIGWNGRDYVLPVLDPQRRMRDLRMYSLGKKFMRSTTGCKVGLLGAQQLESALPKDPVYLCEGEWDAMALKWLLSRLRRPGVVLGLPGAGTFKPEWAEWLRNRDVYCLYDHDEPGAEGELIAKKRLTGVARSLHYVNWPGELPRGFDTRDWIVYGAVERNTPEPCLEKLLKRFEDMPRRERQTSKKRIVLKKSAATPSGPATTLTQVRAAFNKWLFLKDTIAIDVMLATAFSLEIQGPPVWMFLVSPPGGAKTALLMSLEKWAKSFFTSSLTPHALISGANWQGQSDPSLIPRLHGMMLTVKDFTPVFAMRDLDQGEIFGILRDAYDGRCGKIFGNGVERSYTSHFGIIAGVTPKIHELSESHSSLGERFLKYSMGDNLKHDSENEIIQRAIDNVDRNTTMQAELSDVVAAFLDSPRGPMPTIPEMYQKRIIALARLGARIRGSVSKDFRGENIIGRPFAEVGSRLGVQLSKLARSLAWVRGKTEVGEEEYRLLVKVMLDTVAQRQEDLLRAIWKRTHVDVAATTTSVELSLDTAYPNSTVRRMLDDLQLLQVVERRGTTFKYHWRLTPYIMSAIHDAHLYERPEELARTAVVRIRRRPKPSARATA